MKNNMTVTEMARKGGEARAKSMTKAQRVAVAREGAKERWRRYFAAKKQAKIDAGKTPLASK